MQHAVELNMDEVIKKMRQLIGIGLTQLASHPVKTSFQFGVTLNGQQIEQILAAYLRLPNGYPLRGPFHDADGNWHVLFSKAMRVDEEWRPTGGIPLALAKDEPFLPFHDSQLYSKLRRIAIIAYAYTSDAMDEAQIVHVEPFELGAPENRVLREEIEGDYHQAYIVANLEGGNSRLTHLMGKWLTTPISVGQRWRRWSAFLRFRPGTLKSRPRIRVARLNAEKYSVGIFWHTSEGHYVAWIPELSEWGVASGGTTPEQALEGLRFVRDFRLKWLEEKGRPIPRPNTHRRTLED